MNFSLFKNAVIYTVPSFFNAGIALFILPVLTRYLTPDEYGVLANFNALLAVLTVLIGFSSQGAISVNYFKLSKKEISKYVANVFLLLILSTIVSISFFLFFYGHIEESLGVSIGWAIVAVVLAGCNFITLINLTLWQVEQRPRPYAVLQIISGALNIALSVLFVVSFSWGWQGRILGSGFTLIFFAIVNGVFLVKRGYFSLCFVKDYLKDSLLFGLPLIPHQLSFWLRTGADRFILTLMVSTVATGLYNVSFQIGSIIILALTAFNQAWSPYLYKKLRTIDDKQKRELVKFTYLYFAVVLAGSVAAMAFLPHLLTLLVGEKYQGASAFLGYLCLGFAFQGMYFMVVNYVFFVKKTAPLSLITFSGGVVHVLLCYFLVERNGAIGAAQAFSASSLLTFLGVWKLSASVYKMPWFSFRGAW